MIISTLQIASSFLLATSLGSSACGSFPHSYCSNESALYSYKSTSLGEEQQKCYARLDELAAYKANWNGNNAAPFSPELIDKCKKVINELRYQPEIYPTAIDAIQFEYRKKDGSYLEFEIYLDKAKVFCINSEKKHITKIIPLDYVKKEVDAFYESK